MSLGLLAPFALGLLALGLGPILAHLARRRPDQRQVFGAMMLLRRLARKQRRRRRLHDRLLLLLRLLAVLLVALAVARPELRWPGAPPELGGTGAVVVVLDDSLSMDLREGLLPVTEASEEDPGTGTLLSLARQQAAELVRALPPGTKVAAVTLGGEAERLQPELTEDREAVAASILAVRQSHGGTDLAGGLRHARRLLGGQGGEVMVFTDEAGPTAVPAAAEEIALLSAQGSAIRPQVLRASRPSNLAVLDAKYGDGPEGGSVRATVGNFGPDEVEAPVTVELPDGVEITAFVTVPAGGQAEVSVTVPRVAAGGVGLARVLDTALSADDAFAFHLPRVGASRVLVVDGDPGPTPTASEVYFLERALAPWGASAAARAGVLPDITTPDGLGILDPEQHRVVFLANLGDPSQVAGRLNEFVRSGGGLVISLGSNTTAERYNAALSGLLPAPLRQVRALSTSGEAGEPLTLPNTSHPLFAPFARGGRSAFGRVELSRVFTMDPFEDGGGVETLLRLESGIPVLVSREVGRGRVLLLTTTIDLGWTDLPLQAVFMPLVQRITAWLGGEAGGGEERRSVQVGETVSIPLPEGVDEASVGGPRGPVPAQVRNGAISFRVELAGAYMVESPGSPPLAWIAANVDPEESDVRPGPSLVSLAAEVDPDRYLQRRELSAWLMLGGLALALLQALVSGFRSEPGPSEEVAGVA